MSESARMERNAAEVMAAQKRHAFALMYDFRNRRFNRLLGWTFFKREKAHRKARHEGLGAVAADRGRVLKTVRVGTGGKKQRAGKRTRSAGQDPEQGAEVSKRRKQDSSGAVQKAAMSAASSDISRETVSEPTELTTGSHQKKGGESSARPAPAELVSTKKASSQRGLSDTATEGKCRITPTPSPPVSRTKSVASTVLPDSELGGSPLKDALVRDLGETFNAADAGPADAGTGDEKAAPKKSTPARPEARKPSRRKALKRPESESLGAEALRTRSGHAISPRARASKCPRPESTEHSGVRTTRGVRLEPGVEESIRYLGTFGGSGGRRRKQRRKVWKSQAPSLEWYLAFTEKLAQRYEKAVAEDETVELGPIDRWRVEELRRFGRDHLAEAALGRRGLGAGKAGAVRKRGAKKAGGKRRGRKETAGRRGTAGRQRAEQDAGWEEGGGEDAGEQEPTEGGGEGSEAGGAEQEGSPSDTESDEGPTDFREAAHALHAFGRGLRQIVAGDAFADYNRREQEREGRHGGGEELTSAAALGVISQVVYPGGRSGGGGDREAPQEGGGAPAPPAAAAAVIPPDLEEALDRIGRLSLVSVRNCSCAI
jgi:hypothetical protein